MIGTSLPVDSDVRVLCLGAHCDDIEIGCGGTLLTLIEARPNAKVDWVVFSSNDAREAETRKAADTLLGDRVSLSVHRFRNGFFPAVWSDIKDSFELLKGLHNPTLILTHAADDRHQDHRVISELTWNTFRDHTIWEYEIPKFDGDLGRPNLYIPLTRNALETKSRALMDSFPSQRSHQWFTPETFRGIARIRGIECNAAEGFAEAFVCRKQVVGF